MVVPARFQPCWHHQAMTLEGKTFRIHDNTLLTAIFNEHLFACYWALMPGLLAFCDKLSQKKSRLLHHTSVTYAIELYPIYTYTGNQ